MTDIALAVIGGTFTHVAGQPRARLAHVRQSGELDPLWAPDVTGVDAEVKALSVLGDTVYVAGFLPKVDGQAREDLAAVDAVTGRVRAWAPVAKWVSALAAANGKVYVGGEFTRVGSARREHLAAFDAASGALDAWDPVVSGQDLPGDDVTVRDLVVDRGTLYVGGQFDAIAGRIALRSAQADVHRHIEQQGQIRNKPAGGEAIQRREVHVFQPAADALVRRRRVIEPVAHDDRAAIECGPDHLSNHLPARGFGKVWSGDDSIRSRLGWALAEEHGFETQLQGGWLRCCSRLNTVNRPIYLRNSDGRIIRLWPGEVPPGQWRFVTP